MTAHTTSTPQSRESATTSRGCAYAERRPLPDQHGSTRNRRRGLRHTPARLVRPGRAVHSDDETNDTRRGHARPGPCGSSRAPATAPMSPATAGRSRKLPDRRLHSSTAPRSRHRPRDLLRALLAERGTDRGLRLQAARGGRRRGDRDLREHEDGREPVSQHRGADVPRPEDLQGRGLLRPGPGAATLGVEGRRELDAPLPHPSSIRSQVVSITLTRAWAPTRPISDQERSAGRFAGACPRRPPRRTLLAVAQSSSVSFHALSGSRSRRLNRLSCSSAEMWSQNLIRIVPSSVSERSKLLISS